MLNAHSSIAVPHPPHIVKLFSTLERHYGDLNHDRNYRCLIDDVCRMVELHTYPWHIKPDRERIFFQSRDRNLLTIYFQIYDQYLASTGKRRWACKSTFMIEHVEEILRYYPDARFIFMVRDGRDVAVSAKSSIFNHFHVYYSAQRWQREQRLGLDWLARLSPEQISLLNHPSVQRLLLLNAAAQAETLDDVVLAYGGASQAAAGAQGRLRPIAGTILTKLDEAVKLAPALDTCARHSLEIQYVTSGQRVPEDIHPASAAALAHRSLRVPSNPVFALRDDEMPIASIPSVPRMREGT
jgi:hypothetical protein